MSMEKYISDIMVHGIPKTWCDTLTMQSLYSLAEKGFTKKVIWKESTVSDGTIGLFADEPIQKGEVLRRYINQRNLIIFNSAEDIPPLTKSTKEYLSNYMFQTGDVCGFAIPGSSVNHDKERANEIIVKVSDNELTSFATRNIQKGEEILGNYEQYGTPPKWLIDFARKHDVWEYMLFKGYNEYV